jgi:hypothetical protein
MNNQSKIILGLGIVLILATGLIHVVDASESFADDAYLGWLFYANGMAALIAALGIWRGARLGLAFRGRAGCGHAAWLSGQPHGRPPAAPG